MSVRFQQTNAIVDALCVNGWTRDIPMGIQRMLVSASADESGKPRITVASEGNGRGRGAPLFDLYHPNACKVGAMTLPAIVSLKASEEDRMPRNVALTTGKAEHIQGVLQAIRSGMPLYVVAFNTYKGEIHRLVMDAAKIIRENEPVLATGERGFILTISEASRPGNGKRYLYHTLRINIQPGVRAGLFEGWKPVREYGFEVDPAMSVVY
jgi:hypothetical protein